MDWQCPRDGSKNSGDSCKVCGQLPFTTLPVLTGDSVVIRVSSRQRVIGSNDWPLGSQGRGISRRHVRVFFNNGDGRWYVANVSGHGTLMVNGTGLLAGRRAPLAEGDVLLLGRGVSLCVTYEKT